MGRRAEETPEPPVDLRLVPMALAVWVGDLLGLSGGGHGAVLIRWSAVAVAVGALALVVRRPRRWPTVLAAIAGLLAALATSLLQWHAAAGNPLTVAAAAKSWSVVKLTVTSAPRLLVSPFAVAGAAAGNTGGQQWLLDAHAGDSSVAGRGFDADIDLSVLAVGDPWPTVVPGERIQVGGLLSPDAYSVLPGVMLTARTAPTVLARAPWWQRGAADVRQHLVETAEPLSADARGLLPGLVIGNTAAIPADLPRTPRPPA